jgi:hypothetical protein
MFLKPGARHQIDPKSLILLKSNFRFEYIENVLKLFRQGFRTCPPLEEITQMELRGFLDRIHHS